MYVKNQSEQQSESQSEQQSESLFEPRSESQSEPLIEAMEQVKINFTPDRIKYIVYERIAKSVFDNNGIIFGGYVRDKIISDHYKSIYNDANSCNSHQIHKFWNCFNQPETAARTLVAKDMDICMYQKEDVNGFLNALQKIFCDEFGITNISSSEFSAICELSYFGIPIMMSKRIKYVATVGRIPYVYCGTVITFDFDILIPKKSWMQPPFNKIDMLSNVFIMSKQGILMSNNTGTMIDTMSLLNKQKMSAKIMSDIVEFKTQFCMVNNQTSRDRFDCDYEYNRKAVERIQKLLFKTFPWHITNLPFEICDYDKTAAKKTNRAKAAKPTKSASDTDIIDITDTSDTDAATTATVSVETATSTTTKTVETTETAICCICMDGFKKKDRCVEIYIDNSTHTKKVCSCVAHDKCIFKYFEKQLETAKNCEEHAINPSDSFEFRCPMRNVVNFQKCANATNKMIKGILKGL